MTNYSRLALNRISTLVDRYSPERPILLGFRLENVRPPLFIVGTPRSGTTIVYLHLTNQFHFAYFSNISRRMSFFSVPGALLGRAFFRRKSSLENDFGVTRGAMAPSDGWRIFHRWFPRNGTLPIEKMPRLYELKNIVRIYEKLFDAPFINKNNANSVRIRELSELFPDALFIHVHRDPMQSALSLLDARQKHRVHADEGWGPPPPDLKNSRFPSEESLVAQQVVGLQRHIEDSLSVIPDLQRISISYEDFCRAPAQLCKLVEERYRKFGHELVAWPNDLPGSYEIRSKAARFDKATGNSLKREIRNALGDNTALGEKSCQ